MAHQKVIINDKGIKNRLKAIKPFSAICEYIWNGFDAKSKHVEIISTSNEIGTINTLSIKDFGSGVNFHKLESTFKPFLSSEKRASTDLKYISLVHGKNGLGRLTFHKFAQKAVWKTNFLTEVGDIYSYSIEINSDNLDDYDNSDPVLSTSEITGTVVTFDNIDGLSDHYLNSILTPFVEREFSWFLYLFKDNGYSLTINGNQINPDNLVKDKETFSIDVKGISFSVTYIRWSSKLNTQSSRFYFSDENGSFNHSETTQLNNKSDSFYHSIYVSSNYFSNFHATLKEDDLFSNSVNSEEYKELLKELNAYLRTKRKPFLIEYAKELVDNYESTGIFPAFNYGNKWEKLKADDLREAIQELYQIEPKFFKNLNKPQQKILVRMLSLIIDGGEIESFFNIVDGVISLSQEEKEKFSEQLKVTQLSSILKTIELLTDRYKSVEEFKRLVYDPSMYAGEVPHLQKMMERNYWLLGEEYQLVSAEEPDFIEALKRHSYILRGEKLTEIRIDHPSSGREMDLFMVRQRIHENKIEHIVIELKHPVNIRLGKKEVDQVYDYYQVIKNESRFNASNMKWKFYLIGNKYDTTDYIKHSMEPYVGKGDYGLIFKGEYEVYARTWSEIFSEFEIKHDFLNKKLQIEKEKIQSEIYSDANDIVQSHKSSDSSSQFSWSAEVK